MGSLQQQGCSCLPSHALFKAMLPEACWRSRYLQERRLAAECRWVEEYHVDGFRFDLAACLCRDPQGQPLSAPPVIEQISKDPVLSKVSVAAPCRASSGCPGARLLTWACVRLVFGACSHLNVCS